MINTTMYEVIVNGLIAYSQKENPGCRHISIVTDAIRYAVRGNNNALAFGITGDVVTSSEREKSINYNTTTEGLNLNLLENAEDLKEHLIKHVVALESYMLGLGIKYSHARDIEKLIIDASRSIRLHKNRR